MRRGFTLIEIMIVLVIIGTAAGVLLPRMSFVFEADSTALQRLMEEAIDRALSGTPIRLKVDTKGASRRGEIFAEGYLRQEMPEDSLSVFLGTNVTRPPVYDWEELKLKNIPEGEGWRFEPEVISFYRDGSCSPARISYVEPGASESTADEYVLTVTGYCMKVDK
ncbi:MAG: prepilin-type N-terminal cleavage/methylation domain-containing protein [Synergistaceae bacterium]|nr:prepilin-type N-terminal cleavage/methylation domain-containing protein [Synergistaceae bacterium]